MEATAKNNEPVNGSKRLTPEEQLAIPGLYVLLGSKQRVAEQMGCSIATVSRWMDKLSGEEWDRIKEDQRKVILEKSIDILYQALDIVPGKLSAATVRDLMGVVKIMADRIALLGGVGAVDARGGDTPDGIEQFLAAAEAKRRQAAIEEAVRTGSLEGLKAFVTTV